MSRYVRIYTTSIGCKAVMAVSGLLLVMFVIVHLLGNLQIYGGQDKMNAYAAMLQGLGPLLWIARIILLVVFLTHIFAGLRLHRWNIAARPEPYRYNAIAQSDPLRKRGCGRRCSCSTAGW